MCFVRSSLFYYNQAIYSVWTAQSFKCIAEQSLSFISSWNTPLVEIGSSRQLPTALKNPIWRPKIFQSLPYSAS